MLLRTALGAVVGTVAGAGFLQTLTMLTRYCYGNPGRTGCGAGIALTIGPILAFWMVVAGGLIYAGLRLWRAERRWWAAGIGGGLWFVLYLAIVYFSIFHLDMPQEDGHDVLATLYVVAPCVAYAVAALSTSRRQAGRGGRSRASSHIGRAE